MRHLIIAFTLASIVAACNNSPKISAQAKQDSLNLAKAKLKAVQDSLKIDSFQRAEARKEEEKITKARAAERAAQQPRTRQASYVKGYSDYYEQPQPQKKGWSSAAKGAVIGAGAGAVTGILVDKKNARGAIIGGVVGAGTGYAIGRAKDRKTGRVQPKN
jgi:hypothetical protein